LKKDKREFIDAKKEIAGASAGVDMQAVPLHLGRFAYNTYLATDSHLNKGM